MNVVKYIPKTPGGWLAWIAVAIGIIIVYWQVNKIIKQVKNKSTEDQAAKSVTKSNLSYNTVDYNFMADSLYNAMGGNDFITFSIDTDTIYNTLNKLKNADDFYQVVTVFGKRDLSYLNPEANLIGWFNKKLSGSQYSKVKQTLSAINVTI